MTEQLKRILHGGAALILAVLGLAVLFYTVCLVYLLYQLGVS